VRKGRNMSSLSNLEIKSALETWGFRRYHLAKALGISEGMLSRKLRDELSVEEQTSILETISEMVRTRKEMTLGVK
jgi:hypothetical protein